MRGEPRRFLCMPDYYSPHATHALARPLVLTGFVNHVTSRVAHAAASLSGIPLRSLDELIEHALGGSAHQVIRRAGLGAWRDREDCELAKALRDLPAPIIAAGEGTLARSNNLDLVLQHSDLVYLYLPADDACQLAGQQAADFGATIRAEIATLVPDVEEGLRILFDRRRFVYEQADTTVDVRAQSHLQVAHSLLSMLSNDG